MIGLGERKRDNKPYSLAQLVSGLHARFWLKACMTLQRRSDSIILTIDAKGGKWKFAVAMKSQAHL